MGRGGGDRFDREGEIAERETWSILSSDGE
jgi:hypothetical protein